MAQYFPVKNLSMAQFFLPKFHEKTPVNQQTQIIFPLKILWQIFYGSDFDFYDSTYFFPLKLL